MSKFRERNRQSSGHLKHVRSQVEANKQQEYEIIFITANSIKQKFLFTRLFHELKTHGLDDPRGQKALDRLVHGSELTNEDDRGGEQAVRKLFMYAIREDKPIHIVNIVNKNEFQKHKTTVEYNLIREEPDLKPLTKILDRIYRGTAETIRTGEVSQSALTDITGPDGFIDEKLLMEKLEKAKSGSKADDKSMVFTNTGEPKKLISVKTPPRGYLNADELFYFIYVIKRELEERGFIERAPEGAGKEKILGLGKLAADKKKPSGWDELDKIISEVERNPMVRRNVDFRGFGHIELEVVEKSIRMVDEDNRDNCWISLDYMSTHAKNNALMRLARVQSSKIPDEIKKDAINDVFSRGLVFDTQREMLSWIRGGHLFLLGDETDIMDLNKGFKKLGLIEGDKITSVKRGASRNENKWTVSSEKGKTWTLKYNKNKGEIGLYEGDEKSGNQRARMFVDIDVYRGDLHAYDEKTIEYFFEKIGGLGGLHWSKSALTKEYLGKASEIADRIHGKDRILFMRLLSRTLSRPDEEKKQFLNGLSDHLNRTDIKPAEINKIMNNTLHVNYCKELINAVVLEMDFLSAEDKISLGIRLYKRLNEELSKKGTTRSIMREAYGVCNRIDPVSNLHSTEEYLIANEILEATLANKKYKSFLNNAFITALNTGFLREKISYFEEADDVLGHAIYYSEKAHQTSDVLKKIEEDKTFAEFTGKLRDESQIDELSQEDVKKLQDIYAMYTLNALDTKYCVALAEPALILARESPDAAREYTLRYAPKTIVKWDGSILKYEGLMESSKNTINIVEDEKFRRLFVERTDRVKKIREHSMTAIQGMEDRSLAEALSITMARSPEHFRFITDPGILESISANLQKGSKQHILIKEFLGSLGYEPKFNTARAYTIMFRADERTANKARNDIRQETVAEEDLAALGGQEWERMQSNPKAIVEVFRGIEEGKKEYANVLETLDVGVRAEYERLSGKVPELKTKEKVARFKEVTHGHDVNVQKSVLALADSIIEVGGAKKALSVLSSEAITSRLDELSFHKATYSAKRFVELLGEKNKSFKTKLADEVVSKVFEGSEFQAEYAAESAIWDWAAYKGDRETVIKELISAPDACKPFLIDMGACGMQDARQKDPAYIAKLEEFAKQNKDVLALIRPIYVDVTGDGHLNLLRGVGEK